MSDISHDLYFWCHSYVKRMSKVWLDGCQQNCKNTYHSIWYPENSILPDIIHNMGLILSQTNTDIDFSVDTDTYMISTNHIPIPDIDTRYRYRYMLYQYSSYWSNSTCNTEWHFMTMNCQILLRGISQSNLLESCHAASLELIYLKVATRHLWD